MRDQSDLYDIQIRHDTYFQLGIILKSTQSNFNQVSQFMIILKRFDVFPFCRSNLEIKCKKLKHFITNKKIKYNLI